MLTGRSLQEAHYARASAFGYYPISEVPLFNTYILTVSSKRYRFEQPIRIITVMDDLADVNFIGEIY